jgi:hypothetical protein
MQTDIKERHFDIGHSDRTRTQAARRRAIARRREAKYKRDRMMRMEERAGDFRFLDRPSRTLRLMEP